MNPLHFLPPVQWHPNEAGPTRMPWLTPSCSSATERTRSWSEAGGDDNIHGGGGSNILYGGGGNDLLDVRWLTYPDKNQVPGGFESWSAAKRLSVDVMYGGNGDDVLEGSFWEGSHSSAATGADSLRGQDGDDFFDGGSGDDILGGDNGTDRLLGGFGVDRLEGNLGNDVLSGGHGAGFTLRAGNGDYFNRRREQGLT